jgi:hypothetical protein
MKWLAVVLLLPGCAAMNVERGAVDVSNKKPLITDSGIVQPGAVRVNTTLTTQAPLLSWLFDQTGPLVVTQPGTVTVNPNAVNFEVAPGAVHITLETGAITINIDATANGSLFGKKKTLPAGAGEDDQGF